MARFEKTRVHPASAVLFLLGLYALAGLGYAAFSGSRESVAIWAVIALLAFIASFAYQRFVSRRRLP